MNFIFIILGAFVVGIYTAWGLRTYSVFCSQASGILVKFLIFPLFAVLFLGCGFVACNYLNILLGGDTIPTSGLRPGPSAIAVWLGVICTYIAWKWKVLKERFQIASPGQSPPIAVEKTNSSHLGYLPELDGLRGFAIMCVLATHSFGFFKGGFIGVDIFFVLSGFLISTLLFQEYQRSHTFNLRQFYLRRVLRLAPALTVVIIVFLAMSWLQVGAETLRYRLLEVAVVVFYMTNWARAFWFHSPLHFGHTWSLSVEEQFYLLWPLTLLILLRFIPRRSFLAMAICLLAALAWAIRIYLCRHGADAARIYNGLDTRFDSLMTGCLLAALWSNDGLSNKIKAGLRHALVILAPICLLGLIAFTPVANWSDFKMYYWGFVVVEAMAAILILDILINPHSFTRRLFRMKWLVWLGSISYGLYLWHGLVFQFVDDFNFIGTTRFVISIILSLLVSILCYYGAERPFLALKKSRKET